MSKFSINKVYLLGNITKDIELKKTNSGKDVCSFGVATNMSVKDGDGWRDIPTFHNIVAWEGMARVASKLSKGSKVVIEGRIQKRDYEKEDGTKVYIVEVVAEKVIGLSNQDANRKDPKQTATPEQAQEALGGKDISDDVPF